MNPWKQALREGLVSGSLASLLSAGYLAWAGRRRGRTAAPVNAPAHWIFGDRALRQEQPSKWFTPTGYGIHHLASIFWGVLHAKAWGCRPQAGQPLPAAGAALATAAIACVVDYRLTPRRLNPGFEQHLDHREMAAVYGCFALGLAAASLVLARRRTAEAAAAPAPSQAGAAPHA